MDNELLYWVWLAERLGPANGYTTELLEKFGSAFEVYRADAELLTGFDKDGNDAYAKLQNKDLTDATAILKRCEKLDITVIPFSDPQYPERLRSIQKPPTVLYCLGKMPRFDDLLCVGVVGTRKMSEYGCRAAYRISYGLAKVGAVVVSGMALGIDAVATCATFSAGGAAVAVLGSGVDVVYPPRNRKVYNELKYKGTILSEYPPSTTPTRYTFPQRNRIISGLCQGTFVVEGDFNSGALITARAALSQGRELFAMPGKIGDDTANGTNTLIRDGAHTVLDVEDILREFMPLYDRSINLSKLNGRKIDGYDAAVLKKYGVATDFVITNEEKAADDGQNFVQKPKKVEAEPKKPDGSLQKYEELDPKLREIFERIPVNGAVTPDRITGDGISVGDVISGLTMLEIQGLVESLPGGLYSRK